MKQSGGEIFRLVKMGSHLALLFVHIALLFVHVAMLFVHVAMLFVYVAHTHTHLLSQVLRLILFWSQPFHTAVASPAPLATGDGPLLSTEVLGYCQIII